MRSDSLLDIMRDLVTTKAKTVSKQDLAALEQRVERLDELLMKLEESVKGFSDEDLEPNTLNESVLNESVLKDLKSERVSPQ